jgi:hypothetical protein
MRQVVPLILSLLLSLPTLADVSLTGLDNITIDAWAGTTSDLQGSDTYCVLSCQGDCSKTPVREYDVAAYTTGPTDSAGNFYLRHSNGVNTLRVTLLWSHPALGAFALSNYNRTSQTVPPSPYAPGAANCGEVNSQNTIAVRVSAGDLGSALAGTYAQTISVDMCRLQGNSRRECVAPVSFVVNLPELIQLTQLQDFAFGNWNGTSSLLTSHNFCVFRNSAGRFSLTAVGSHDGGGQFRVNKGSDNIPYRLRFRAAGAWYTATPGNRLAGATTGFLGNNTRDCGGGTSHSVDVFVQQSDLTNARGGAYSDTLTVLVQPD